MQITQIIKSKAELWVLTWKIYWKWKVFLSTVNILFLIFVLSGCAFNFTIFNELSLESVELIQKVEALDHLVISRAKKMSRAERANFGRAVKTLRSFSKTLIEFASRHDHKENSVAALAVSFIKAKYAYLLIRNDLMETKVWASIKESDRVQLRDIDLEIMILSAKAISTYKSMVDSKSLVSDMYAAGDLLAKGIKLVGGF